MTTRFLILGMGRTGSNLLQSLLASHSRATCYGELFNDTVADRVLWQTKRASTADDVALRDTDPVRFLAERVYAAAGEDILATGFKLFYYHARQEPWAPIWPWLHAQRDLVVLHLRRRNLLKRIVSEELARRSGRWASTKDEAHDDVQIELTVDQCRNSFERMRRWEQEGDEFFRDHPVVQLTYEDLAADTGAMTRNIQEALGLPLQTLSTPMKRQTKRPTHEVVANFAALRQAFAGTEWESFFVAPEQ